MGRLLCKLGIHKRQAVYWREYVAYVRADGQIEDRPYEMAAWRCIRCEVQDDVYTGPVLEWSRDG